MIEPSECWLQFLPTGENIRARIEGLTPERVSRGITESWWSSEDLDTTFEPEPIDRFWHWGEIEIERDGFILASELVGVVTADQYVQGAMLISLDPVPSTLDEVSQSLFVELLFTAPHNRPQLRRDRARYYGGVGLVLLAWGAALSRKLGFGGRLQLDGSPDFLGWYERLGFRKLPIESMVFEGVQYTPMELTPAEALRVLLREASK